MAIRGFSAEAEEQRQSAMFSSNMKTYCVFKTVMAISAFCVLSTLYSAEWIYATSGIFYKIRNDVNEAIRGNSSLVLKHASYHKSRNHGVNNTTDKRVEDISKNRKKAFNGTTSSEPHVDQNYKENDYKQRVCMKRKEHFQRENIMTETDILLYNSSIREGHSNTKSSEKFAIDSSRIKIGFLIPSSTTNIQDLSLYDLPLVRISLPSLYNTFEKKYLYKIYVGVDKGDRLENFKEEIQTMFDCVVMVYSVGKTFVKSVNTIAEKAYNDGMDYLVRINDDTKFVTVNWTSLAIEKLKAYVPQNIGVVGPTCTYGNVNILTHDMVHRTHLEIFNFYYPPYFENWWADDWITRVYEPNRSSKLKSWTVKHLEGKRRYDVDFKRQDWLETLLELDKMRLWKYLDYS